MEVLPAGVRVVAQVVDPSEDDVAARPSRAALRVIGGAAGESQLGRVVTVAANRLPRGWQVGTVVALVADPAAPDGLRIGPPAPGED